MVLDIVINPQILISGPILGIETLVGRCKTTLWADIHHEHPKPYELELMAVDASQPGDIIIAASSRM
jgi:hypothetical protein